MASTFMDVLLFQGAGPVSRDAAGGGSWFSLETNMDWWTDGTAAQLQEGGPVNEAEREGGLGPPHPTVTSDQRL